VSELDRRQLVVAYDALPHGSAERRELLERHGVSRNQLANWRSRLGMRVCRCGAALPKQRARCDPCDRRHKKDRSLRALYGITIDEYDRLVAEHDGRCAACGAEPNPDGARPEQSLHVDHDHTTGAIRGLLCGRCNFTIGHALHDPDRLRRLADYLDRYA
jgi:hypothetical protein